ncbi:MAG: segregation/condensation protein A [Clostridia bacterium]|nr:segregation/condensation protein A [Clostridia bacterium]
MSDLTDKTENEERELQSEQPVQQNIYDYYSIKANGFESVVDYTTKLSNFEGPLDLLLYLVNKAEISIRDIFVSEVTEQFIEYVRSADDLDMEKESEYLGMAATLLEIKSKELLPIMQFEWDQEDDYFMDEESPQENIFRQLEEYKLFKEASENLKEQETVNIFYKEPDESANDVRIEYTDFNLNNLVKAFSKLLERLDLEKRIKNSQKEIPKEVFTVADKINYIKTTMLERQSCSFFELFKEDASRMEIITTFQALLELLKLQYLTYEQKETFGDITINLREDRSEEVGDLSEYN